MQGGLGVALFGVDSGGTFTDVCAADGRVVKVSSTPRNPEDAIIAGLRAIGAADGTVAHGTTVATNAVLERKGARTVLITTQGFEDVLEIRRQNRPAIYDLHRRWPDPLVPAARRFGVAERLDVQGHEITTLTADEAARVAHAADAAGAESVAVCFLFSFIDAGHELMVHEALRRQFDGRVTVSLSHQIAPHYGEYERTSTTVVNAYVLPIMQRYLGRLSDELRALGIQGLHIMHSNGGLVGAEELKDRAVQTILSGPAAGVVGAREVARVGGRDQIITFDMGGTSTDVAVVPGELLERTDAEVETFPLLVPMLAIETVGAGGGSIARVDAGGAIRVGPESAGADPGPAAYGRGELPTVTDANLVLGRLSPAGLLDGAVSLDAERAARALHPLSRRLGLPLQRAAWAVVRLCISNMERAVRALTLQRGYDPRLFTLVAFGGAGPMHAAELADGLGIREIMVPPHPGVMAALGLTVPDLQRDVRKTVLLPLDQNTGERLRHVRGALEARARDAMGRERRDGFGDTGLDAWLEMRYVGQSFELRVPYAESPAQLAEAFAQEYTSRYGYTHDRQPVEVVHLQVRATAPRMQQPQLIPAWPEQVRPQERRRVWFGSDIGDGDLLELEVPVLWRPGLSAGFVMEGPFLLEQYDSVTVVPPGWAGRVDERFILVLTRTGS